MEAAAAMQSIRLMSGYMEGPYTHASSPSGTFKNKGVDRKKCSRASSPG